MNFCPMTLTNTHLRTWVIGTNLGLFLALVELKGQLFSYLDNLTGLNNFGEGMQRGRKDGGDRYPLQSSLCLIETLCF